MSEPREWWIYNKPDLWRATQNEFEADSYPAPHPVIHVIEYSAYVGLKAENERLKAELEQAKETIKQQNADIYVGLANRARHERDELKAENERLKGIEQDRQDDWKRIQDAERENERLKAELEQVKKQLQEITEIRNLVQIEARQALEEK